MERLMTTMVLALSTSRMGMPAIGEPRWRAAVVLVTSFAFYPAMFACEVSVSIDPPPSVYSSMSQTHHDDAGIVECGELDCCASLQQSAEELAPTQLCAPRASGA